VALGVQAFLCASERVSHSTTLLFLGKPSARFVSYHTLLFIAIGRRTELTIRTAHASTP